MAVQPTTAHPTDRDRENASLRQEVAKRQQEAYAEALMLALGTLGPGWMPWMKITLIDSGHRQSGNSEPVIK